MAAQGVPNYFGEQRFGRGEGNLHRAQALFAGELRQAPRHQRGLWLSAARSQLFNQVLALRVERGDWDRPLAGDCLQLAGSNSFFLAEAPDAALIARVQAGELHPSGPLWGRGPRRPAARRPRSRPPPWLGFDPWLQGLAAAGMDQERRPLRLMPADWSWAWVDDTDLEIAFRLPAGAFATAVLRELVELGPGRRRRVAACLDGPWCADRLDPWERAPSPRWAADRASRRAGGLSRPFPFPATPE